MEPTSVTNPPAAWSRGPRIRALSTRQAEFVLTRNHVGRVAFHDGTRVELLPVHYVYADGMVVARTSRGVKDSIWQQRPDVVFEVDESQALFEWRSVIVRGTLRVLATTGSREQRLEHWNAVGIIRTLIRDAFTERDPTPGRQVIFTITPNEISGREASASYLSRSS